MVYTFQKALYTFQKLVYTFQRACLTIQKGEDYLITFNEIEANKKGNIYEVLKYVFEEDVKKYYINITIEEIDQQLSYLTIFLEEFYFHFIPLNSRKL